MQSGGDASLAALGGGLAVAQSISQLSPDGQNLRNGLQQLTFKLNSYAGYTPAQFQSATNAQAISAGIASVAQTLSNASVSNAANEVDALKATMPYDLTAQRSIYSPGGSSVSTIWDVMIYPNIMTRMIHIQASYAAAMVQMLSQQISFMSPAQVSSMSTMVQGLVARLGSLPA